MDPGAQRKTMLKTYPNNSKHIQKMTPKSIPQSKGILGGGASWGTFGGPNRFWTLKWAPTVPKVLPMIEKLTKNDTKEPQDCEKELQKSSLFETWPGGLREAP